MPIDGFGPNTADPSLQHEITLAFIRWFKDHTLPLRTASRRLS
jgi:hypothetical protein